MNLRLPRLLPALLVLTLPLAAQTSVWKVTRGDAVLYLGGTCHVLRPTDFPLPPEFEQAFAASTKVLFETDLARAQSPEMQQVVRQHGLFTDGRTLKSVLTPEAWTAVEAYCAKSGLPVAQVMPMKPWLFALILTVGEMQKLGLSLEGVDAHYFKQARAAGKAVGELESFEQHMKFIINLGAGHESEMIAKTLEDLADMPKLLDGILTSWKKGDLAAIEQTMLREMRDKYPAIYRPLIVERNQAWLPKLEAMLGTPEVEFVLAGVGHMAGPDGLIPQLRARGCTVEQVTKP